MKHRHSLASFHSFIGFRAAVPAFVLAGAFLSSHCSSASSGKGGGGFGGSGAGGYFSAGGTGGCSECDGAVSDASLPYCGDGAVNRSGEQCDDGNTNPGDGCSTVCVLEADYVCPDPGQPCRSTVICGDGRVTGSEQCDDKNTAALDGCSNTCQLELGYRCPFPGLPCAAAECGDGVVAGREECDDDNAAPLDGCSDLCRLENGWKCVTAGSPCETTTCGDGAAEGTEQCDDANTDLGDGCSPFCGKEPDCSQGACASACGDGIVLGSEGCDDGNLRNGDGCSSTCTAETGYTCVQPPLPAQMDLPLVVRDFDAVDPVPSTSGSPVDYASANHVDFELVSGESGGTDDGSSTRIVRAGQGSSATGRGLDLGQAGETAVIQHLDGAAIATVSLAGKPVYALSRAQCDKTALPGTGNNWDKCTTTTMDGDSFHTWYVDRSSSGQAVTWPNFLGRKSTALKRLTLLLGGFDANAAFTAGGTSYTFDSRYMRIDGSIPAVIGGTDPVLRTRGFFPVDELGTTGTTCNDSQGGNEPHNFHFTSEVRFWFQYGAGSVPTLDFSGDDDVWVYVNGHLVLDIGGIHGRDARSFSIDAGNATAWGLADGSVYEVAVFQAERNQCASNYWLTLQGFNTAKSACSSTCGDGVVASDEACDDGANNATGNPPGYGQCASDCKTRGPYCGDGILDSAHEACDNGVNASVYDVGGVGCAPGCVAPPKCGDGQIQSPYEQCDEGTNTGTYGGCSALCQLGSRCGDRVVQPPEQCDEGPAGGAECTPDCVLVIR